MKKPLPLTVNGQVRQAADGATVLTLLRDIGLDPAKVAVERNREIVSRSLYAATPLGEGDEVEIVQIVGGG